ncbi:MAG: cytochrome c assembly protein [Terrimonas sp.]|nr:cytochrome c assembly protein [Terrimonas sp.]
MDYIGEQLLPGRIGQFLIILTFVSSLIATFSYFKAVRSTDENEKRGWVKLARISFIADAFAVFAIFGILFYLFYHHRYEYFYIYKNSSNSLEFKYIFSAIWSASEGSFLLWTVWHAVLGLILLKTAKKWEAPVMTVLSFAQLCLATMLLGLYFFDLKVGSSPFALFRHQMAELPLFTSPDYISRLRDGNDLSPLLQNYWMVIHPPILFLGFALTIVPFAYGIAGLWTRKFGDWIQPALPWALVCGGVLGLGIMMGGAWAYESLNFGGYWAWDPVENASLVPWMTLVAGIHTLLIYRHTGRSLRATHLFFIITYILVIYSTFLTRSGILGDTSVHSFADLGMNTQLLLFLLAFTLPSLLLYFLRRKQVPVIAKEEATSSREFWMFIGSLVLVLSAGFIIIATSLPVFNKLFGSGLTMGEDPVFAYNRVIIFVAIIIGLLTAVTQYLKYKETAMSFFRKRILWPLVISLAIAILILAFGNINYQLHGSGYLAAIWIAVVSSVFTVVANLSYIWIGVKGKLKLSGGSVAHFGFGLMLVGILISSSKKEVLSYNTSGIYVPLGQDSKEKPGENLTLVKGVPTRMGDYQVTYTEEKKHPGKSQWYYYLDFKNNNGKEEFYLRPNAFINYKGNKGLMANPDAKRYWDHDIFTYITSLPDPERNQDTSSFVTRHINKGDTAFYANGYYVLENIQSFDSIPVQGFNKGDKASVATIKVFSKNNKTYSSKPILVEASGGSFSNPDTVVTENLVFRLEKTEGDHIDLGVKESDTVMQYVTLKAYKFPFINVLWAGTLIMVIGFLISMLRRMETRKLKKAD